MDERHFVRADPRRVRLYDTSTGETVVIALPQQDGLSKEDAQHKARDAQRGERESPH